MEEGSDDAQPLQAMTGAVASPTDTSLLGWQVQPVVAVLVLAVGSLYAWGTVRVGRRHPARAWRLGWAASFYGGLATVAVALWSVVGRYGTTFFWIHMIQHLLLIMVAPALLIHGRPLILALHACRNPWHTRIKQLLRSRVVTVLTCPVFAIPFYAAVVVGTHLTSFNNLVITNRFAESVELTAYVVAGYLYLLSGFGDEPIRWRLSGPAKMLIILLSMPVDTFTGITLLMTGQPPWPAYATRYPGWGPDLLTDVHWGGAMMWIGGDTIMIALIVTAMVPWLRGRGRAGGRMRWVEKARRANLDRYLQDPALAAAEHRNVDDDDAVLDAYNAWLARTSGNNPAG